MFVRGLWPTSLRINIDSPTQWLWASFTWDLALIQPVWQPVRGQKAPKCDVCWLRLSKSSFISSKRSEYSFPALSLHQYYWPSNCSGTHRGRDQMSSFHPRSCDFCTQVTLCPLPPSQLCLPPAPFPQTLRPHLSLHSFSRRCPCPGSDLPKSRDCPSLPAASRPGPIPFLQELSLDLQVKFFSFIPMFPSTLLCNSALNAGNGKRTKF